MLYNNLDQKYLFLPTWIVPLWCPVPQSNSHLVILQGEEGQVKLGASDDLLRPTTCWISGSINAARQKKIMKQFPEWLRETPLLILSWFYTIQFPKPSSTASGNDLHIPLHLTWSPSKPQIFMVFSILFGSKDALVLQERSSQIIQLSHTTS